MIKKLDRRGGWNSAREGPGDIVDVLCSKPPKRRESECQDWQRWILNVTDERAAAKGCWFDARLGGYAVWWVERYCRLYEGRWAGQPAIVHGCKECNGWTVPVDFDEEWAIERADLYLDCRASGHDLAWPYDFLMRLFGWLRDDPDLGPIRRFRNADFWVPKKNAKSPMLAFLGWYLLCGDGEPGQRVYFGAKDGAQAKEIVGSHATEVFNQSEEIQSCVRYKINEMQFEHEPTRSRMKPLSSSNARTTKSKEGINGSVIIDEKHVVDGEFMQRIARAGISRTEPLQIGGSTAGLEITGYGKRAQDYGRQVMEGKHPDDDDTLCVIYEAPQDTALEDLTEDEAVELGRRSNPMWGITVLEREFRSDFRRSKAGTLDQLYAFATYRLNIWQATTTPWIPPGAWAACGVEFDIEDYRDADCYLGLDLSRTRDMTAACFVFEMRDGRRPVWPLFWIPENTAKKHQVDVADFLGWQAAGVIHFTPQDTISQSQVFDELSPLLAMLNVKACFYDPNGADWLTEQISEQFYIDRVVFPQTLKTYAEPTDQFEQELLDGTLLHPNHPVLSWQAGHVHVYRSRMTKEKRPVKPSSDEHERRTVDGVQAMVMGFAGVLGDNGKSDADDTYLSAEELAQYA